VFSFDRVIPFHVFRVGRRSARVTRGGSPTGRRSSTGFFVRIRALILGACAVGIAAIAGWMLAGGNLPSGDVLFARTDSVAVDTLAGGTPVHVASTPSGAQVRIDDARYGKTPLDVRLSPGSHRLTLAHPDALDEEQMIQVAETGTVINIGLWRRRPDVVPLRPVYPGASLVDAWFLDDGRVALVVGLPARGGAPAGSRELWQLDPSTGQLSRLSFPGQEESASTLVPAPGGEQVAYVVPGSASAVTTSLSGSPPSASRPFWAS
jgi:hypothetical protein